MSATLPAGSWLGHGDGRNAFSSSHLGDVALDLGLGAIVADVGHDDVGVQGKARASAVAIHPAHRCRDSQRGNQGIRASQGLHTKSRGSETLRDQLWSEVPPFYYGFYPSPYPMNISACFQIQIQTYCSSQTTAVENRSAPIPPCSSGMQIASSPCSPAFSHTSLLTSPAFSHL